MEKYTKAYKGEGKEIIYEDDHGKKVIYRDGSKAWRNNNPGNIERGSFSKNNGSIGDDGRFAVFPDYKTGRNSLENLLKEKLYKDLKVEDAIKKYAPAHENDTEGYIRFIEKNAGISRKIKMNDMSPDGIKVFADVIERFEGNILGKKIPVPKKKPIFDATGRFIRD